MPRGSKSRNSTKQKRKTQRGEEAYEKRGASKGEAEKSGWIAVGKTEVKGRRGTATRTRAVAGGRRGTSRTRATGRRAGARKSTRAGARSSR
jgi:hypothetical protein